MLSLILRWKFKSNTGIIADNRDSVNQSECSIEIHCSWLRINPEAYSFTTNLAHGKLITSQTTLRRKWRWYIIEKFCRNLLLLLRRNSIANDLIKEYAQTFFKINFRFLFIHLLIFIRLVQDILSFFWFFFFSGTELASTRVVYLTAAVFWQPSSAKKPREKTNFAWVIMDINSAI